MNITIHDDAAAMGRAAAAEAAAALTAAIDENGEATLVVATGASQFEVLAALVAADVDWSRVHGFHLDEYVGLSMSHPASFRRYLKERLVDRVPLASFHYLDAEHDPRQTAETAATAIGERTVDLLLCGIGENGHLAFNDPPADFETPLPYLVVELDEACRRQQVGEGWFETLDDVPTAAISMSIRQLLRSRRIICSVPDERKAAAVCDALEGEVTPDVPASVLQTHAGVSLHLDAAAASRLSGDAGDVRRATDP